jgi:hypothetical protein
MTVKIELYFLMSQTLINKFYKTIKNVIIEYKRAVGKILYKKLPDFP